MNKDSNDKQKDLFRNDEPPACPYGIIFWRNLDFFARLRQNIILLFGAIGSFW